MILKKKNEFGVRIEHSCFVKSFYNSKFSLLAGRYFMYPLPLFSKLINLLHIYRLWIFAFNHYFLVGFELWGLGLNIFLANKRTKLGKKYKDKRKKKKLSTFNQITIHLKNRYKLVKKKFFIKKSFFFFFKASSVLAKFKTFINNYRFNLAHFRQKYSFKMGLSHRVGFFEPLFMRLLEQRKLSDFRRKRFLFLSNDIASLKQWSLIIRHLKGLNIYKFRGMKFMREDIDLKIGKVGRL